MEYKYDSVLIYLNSAKAMYFHTQTGSWPVFLMYGVKVIINLYKLSGVGGWV